MKIDAKPQIMEVHKRFVAKVILLSLSLNIVTALSDNTYATTQISSSECYDNFGQPRVSLVSRPEHDLRDRANYDGRCSCRREFDEN